MRWMNEKSYMRGKKMGLRFLEMRKFREREREREREIDIHPP